MDLREILEKLHVAVAEDLLAKVLDEEDGATAQELNAAIKLLRDNNITVAPHSDGGARLRSIADAMPFQDDDDAYGT